MKLLAHGIAAGADVPIPMTVAAAAAALVLVVSFVVLAFGWTQPRLGRLAARERALPKPLDVMLPEPTCCARTCRTPPEPKATLPALVTFT